MSAPHSDEVTGTNVPPVALSGATEPRTAAKMRTSLLSRWQARIGRRLIQLIGQGLFGLRFELAGLEQVPPGEPVIVAAAPHRSWIDPFLIISALPASPRLVYLGSVEAMFNRRWKRVVLRLMGGVVPVSSLGQLNREGLEISLAILAGGNSLGLFPEGWGRFGDDPGQVSDFKRGVAFLSQRSGRRVLPVGLAGTQQLWRGKTLRLTVGPPLAPLAPAAGRTEQVAFTEQIRAAITAAAPPLPDEPAGNPRVWRWLTRLLG